MGVENVSNIQIVLVDLDGTLLNAEKKIGQNDYRMLEMLGKQKILRVFATGRNLFSVLKVLPNTTPVDYLIFSCGAGVLNWKTKEVLFESAIKKPKVLEIEKLLKSMRLNFSIHFPIPDNHKYYYYRGNTTTADFERRNSIYNGFSYELQNEYPLDLATQFIVILKDEKEFRLVASKINDLNVIRATSPLDNKSVWLEIFNNDVSKALGGQFLCDKLNIPTDFSLAIGNDYNDIDMLNWAKHSFIVKNAPAVLLQKYNQCTDNDNNPLSNAIQILKG